MYFVEKVFVQMQMKKKCERERLNRAKNFTRPLHFTASASGSVHHTYITSDMCRYTHYIPTKMAEMLD